MASATTKPRPQKRRVQPQQVLPTQPTSPVVTPGRKAVHVFGKLKEQAAIAQRCLEPGRRVFVDIPQDGIVNYHKARRCRLWLLQLHASTQVLRAQGVDPRSKQKPRAPGSPRVRTRGYTGSRSPPHRASASLVASTPSSASSSASSSSTTYGVVQPNTPSTDRPTATGIRHGEQQQQRGQQRGRDGRGGGRCTPQGRWRQAGR